jgi:hypothetical protein
MLNGLALSWVQPRFHFISFPAHLDEGEEESVEEMKECSGMGA